MSVMTPQERRRLDAEIARLERTQDTVRRALTLLRERFPERSAEQPRERKAS